MHQFFKSITSPLLSLATVMVAVGLFSTFVPLRLTLEGHHSFIIGSVTAAYFAGIVLGSLRTGAFVARIGLIRTFASFAAAAGAISIFMGLVVHPYLWLCTRFIMGFFTSGIFLVIESWLLMIGGKEQKGTILAYYMIVFYAAQSGGQFLLNRAEPTSFVPFSIASLFIALSILPVCLTKHQSPSTEARSRLNPLQLFKISPYGVMSSLGAGLIMGSFFGLAPVFAHKIGLKVSQVGTYMGMTILGGFILQWPIGKLSDLTNRKGVLMVVGFITTIIATTIAIFSIGSTSSFLWLLAVLFGGFSFTLYPLSISYTNDYLDRKDVVAGAGGLLVAYGAGSVLGPLIAPLPMHLFGPSGLYFYFATVSTLLGLGGFYRKRAKKRSSTHSVSEVVRLIQSEKLGEVKSETEPSEPLS